MSDFDIKGLTDKLEAGEGCSLKTALQNSKFDEQENVFDDIRDEALGRPSTKLSFEKREVIIENPDHSDTGERIPVLDIRNQGSIIFEAFKPPQREDVLGACKGKFLTEGGLNDRVQQLPELELEKK